MFGVKESLSVGIEPVEVLVDDFHQALKGK